MYLQAGPFSVLYENGFLRYLSYGNAEVVRMIYYAFRDENWGTLDKVMEDEAIVKEERAFSVRYRSFHLKDGEKIFVWNVEIDGRENGEVTFMLEGTALAPVLKNRTGFCIHHPPEGTSGEPVEITEPGSAKYTSVFPEYISPGNPFKNIAAMRWRCGGAWYRLDFEGDVFETEDQRNWTDASFKTFCTPLDLPFPVLLNEGQKIRQKITFRHERKQPPLSPGGREVVLTLTGGTRDRLPLGTMLPLKEGENEAFIDLFRQLGLHHYRVDIRPEQEEWEEKLRKSAHLLTGLAAKLELVIHAGAEPGIRPDEIAAYLLKLKIPMHSVAIFPDDITKLPDTFATLVSEWKACCPHFNIGIGTDYNFTEVNRNRVLPRIPDFVSYGIQPQEHAFDDLSLVENLAAQADTVRTLKHVYGQSCRAHISPITFKKRFNPYATDPAQRVVPEDAQVDERQYTAFGAAWTLGSIKNLIMAGAGSATCFQGAGKLGIAGEDLKPFPVFEALKLYHSSHPSRVLTSVSGAPLIADGLFFENGTAIIWNYTGSRQSVVLPGGEKVIVEGNEIRKVGFDGIFVTLRPNYYSNES